MRGCIDGLWKDLYPADDNLTLDLASGEALE